MKIFMRGLACFLCAFFVFVFTAIFLQFVFDFITVISFTPHASRNYESFTNILAIIVGGYFGYKTNTAMLAKKRPDYKDAF